MNKAINNKLFPSRPPLIENTQQIKKGTQLSNFYSNIYKTLYQWKLYDTVYDMLQINIRYFKQPLSI